MTTTFKDVFDGAAASFRTEPAGALATFQAASRQVQGLESEVTIRQFRIGVDEPEGLGGTDTAPNPVEYVLAALAACQEITYRLYAAARGVPLDGVRVALEGDIDLRGFFAVDGQVRPGFTGIHGTVELDSPASPEALAALKAEVDAHCPVLDILRAPVPVSLALAPARSGAAAA